MTTVYEVIDAYEHLQADGTLQLTRHATERTERRQLPEAFLIDTIQEQPLVGGVVQPPENRLKLWLPMPDNAPMTYSEDKDLVLVLAETGLTRLIT